MRDNESFHPSSLPDASGELSRHPAARSYAASFRKGGGLVDAADARIIRKEGNTPFVPRIGLPLFPQLARIRGARLEVIERCGHPPPIECPEAFAHAVNRFLA